MRPANGKLAWSADAATYSAAGATGDISNTNLYSNPLSLRHLSAFSIQCVLAGATVTGSLKLQCSNSDPHYDGKAFPDAASMNWTDIDGSSQAFTAAGNVTWNAQGVGYLWVRVVWTESGAAAGTVTGQFNGKGET